MNPVIEEALTNLIKRVNDLEDKLSGIPNSICNSKQPISKKYAQGQATDKQLNYIRTLGGEAIEGMTKEDAGALIDNLLEGKDTSREDLEEKLSRKIEVTEPKEVDTDEAGVDGEGFL